MKKREIAKIGFTTLANMWGIPTKSKPVVIIHPRRKTPFFEMKFPHKFINRKNKKQ